MKRTLIGLTMTLACLVNPAFSAEVTVYSLETGLQSLPMPEPIRVPGNLSLVLLPRETVSVPSPFDVSMRRFEVCVSAEPDAPELALAMPDYASLEPLTAGAYLALQDGEQESCRQVKIHSNPNQIGKIVTLLLAPE